MELSKGLKELIAASLKNGKLEKKEREVILKKAENEGLDLAEFEIFLESWLIEKQSENDEGSMSVPILGQKITYSKRSSKIVIILAPLLLISMGVGLYFLVSNEMEKEANEKLKHQKKYGCDNFEDCLTKYQFDGATFFYAQNPTQDKEEKLINAQVAYWCSEKKFDKAFNILQEYKINAQYNLNTGDKEDGANKSYNNQANYFNNLLDDIISKMLTTDQPKEQILSYCKAFKPIVVGNDKDKAYFGLGDPKTSILSTQPQEKALLKVNTESKNITK